jgi:hypothetical protein
MPSAWNMFVKKIYEEGKAKDPKYEFKQALVDASKRKGEMGSMTSSMKKAKTAKKSRGKDRKRGKKTRRNYRR